MTVKHRKWDIAGSGRDCYESMDNAKWICYRAGINIRWNRTDVYSYGDMNETSFRVYMNG